MCSFPDRYRLFVICNCSSPSYYRRIVQEAKADAVTKWPKMVAIEWAMVPKNLDIVHLKPLYHGNFTQWFAGITKHDVLRDRSGYSQKNQVLNQILQNDDGNADEIFLIAYLLISI